MKRLILGSLLVLLCACTQNSKAFKPVYGEIDADEIDVASRLPGRVKKLLVQPGQKVTVGTPLVEFDDDVLAAKRRRAEATITAAESQKGIADDAVREEEKQQLKAAVAAAKSQMKFAQSTFGRSRDLFKEGAISRQQYEEIEFKSQAATENYRATLWRLKMAEKGARQEQKDGAKALVDQAKTGLEEVAAFDKDTILQSPIDGEVFQILNHEGELVPTGYPVVTLVKIKEPFVTIRIPETELPKFPMGKEVNVRIPALGAAAKPLPAAVGYVGAMANFATKTFTQDRGTFDVKTFELRFTFKGEAPGLRPGMTAVVEPKP